MREASAWLARGRPMSGTLEVFAQRCARCRRGLYISVREKEWGKDFCRGCDEEQGQCYCPSTTEVV